MKVRIITSPSGDKYQAQAHKGTSRKWSKHCPIVKEWSITLEPDEFREQVRVWAKRHGHTITNMRFD